MLRRGHPLPLQESRAFRAESRVVPADPAPALRLPALQVQQASALRLPAACRGVQVEPRHPVPVSHPVRALAATLRQAVAWRHPDVHHPGDRQAGARPAPVSARALQASVLRPRAACSGVRPERRHPVQVQALRHPASESAANARLPARASAVCLAAAALQRAAAGSVRDERAQPQAAVSPASQQGAQGARAQQPAAALRVSRVQPRAAPAVQAQEPAQVWRQAARAVRARRPAAAPDARRAVPAGREPGAARDAVRLPEAVSALPVRRRAVRAAQVLRAGSVSRARRRAAERDGRAARPREAPADVARRRAEPDGRERPAPAAASAFRQVRVLPLAAPVRRPAAKFVRATRRWRTASPSAQSWQAARDEALSCIWSPRRKVWAGKKVRAEQFGRTMNCQPLGRIVAGAESSAKFISTS
ncbi:hypothetical protein ACVIW0_000062 [Bradyrhizobium sp. USDA 4454]